MKTFIYFRSLAGWYCGLTEIKGRACGGSCCVCNSRSTNRSMALGYQRQTVRPVSPSDRKINNVAFMRIDTGWLWSSVISPDEIQLSGPIACALMRDQTPNSQTTVIGSFLFFWLKTFEKTVGRSLMLTRLALTKAKRCTGSPLSQEIFGRGCHWVIEVWLIFTKAIKRNRPAMIMVTRINPGFVCCRAGSDLRITR